MRNVLIVVTFLRNLVAIAVVLVVCWGFVALVALTLWAFLTGKL